MALESNALVGGAPRHFALVPAAGVGRRLGADQPKQYLALGAQTMLEHSVQALLALPWLIEIVVVVAPDDDRAAALPGLRDPRVRIAAVGGATRRDSVLAGLQALAGSAAEHDWVWVHDAARPGLDAAAGQRLVAALAEQPCGALLALPVADTLKRVDAEGRVGSLAREGVWLAQTPQVFPLGRLCQALQRHPDVTDESSAIEAEGGCPALVLGSRHNFKVTTVEDWQTMQHTLTQPGRMPALRIGQGWDVHRLVTGRPLVLGGVPIAHSLGLLGHSDADVLLHAITDAVLGGAGLGDIGRHFPDTDPQFAGADSRGLLAEAVRRAQAAGWSLSNIDATVVAQAPRLAPHIPAMVACIAQTCGVAPSVVNVKAKTAERLGFAGREEGIEAHASVLLQACSPTTARP